MRKHKSAEQIVRQYGEDILRSGGMQQEKTFMQHGRVSVYGHSLMVAVLCVRIARALAIRVNTRSLVRGALLHDYFLYDWHVPDKSHRLHAFYHAGRAAHNAQRDFGLNDIERNMIRSHMFPLGRVLPRYRESLILCAADKLRAAGETAAGLRDRLGSGLVGLRCREKDKKKGRGNKP